MIQNPVLPGKKLPELTNPASAENIENGYQAINSNNEVVVGNLTKPEPTTIENVSYTTPASITSAGYTIPTTNLSKNEFYVFGYVAGSEYIVIFNGTKAHCYYSRSGSTSYINYYMGVYDIVRNSNSITIKSYPGSIQGNKTISLTVIDIP